MRRTIKSIEVVDDLTVKVNTTSPQIGLPASLSRAVAPGGRHHAQGLYREGRRGRVPQEADRQRPWKFVRNVPGDRIEFTAVPRRTGAAGRTSRI